MRVGPRWRGEKKEEVVGGGRVSPEFHDHNRGHGAPTRPYCWRWGGGC